MIDNNLGKINRTRTPFLHAYTLSGILVDITYVDISNFTGVLIFWNGNKTWYRNGKVHREDGPARINHLHFSWYKNDIEYFKTNYMENVPKESFDMLHNLLILKKLL